jgi:hypothetical protein
MGERVGAEHDFAFGGQMDYHTGTEVQPASGRR